MGLGQVQRILSCELCKGLHTCDTLVLNTSIPVGKHRISFGCPFFVLHSVAMDQGGAPLGLQYAEHSEYSQTVGRIHGYKQSKVS